jgi:hypothetical protein
VKVNLVIAGVGEAQGQAAAERRIAEVLEDAFASGVGELNVVLTAAPKGYAVAFARGMLGHTSPRDYCRKVQTALRQAGLAVVGDCTSS